MAAEHRHTHDVTAMLGRHVSPWVATTNAGGLDGGRPSAECDVIVLGGGVTGMTTALLLQRDGVQVTVIEAESLTASVTAHSTVKVTVGHGTAYSAIDRQRGPGVARAYAEANVAGFRQILDLVDGLAIDCMLETGLPHVVYAESPAEAELVENEAEAAARAGLAVSRPQALPLPFDVDAAISFDGQAQFHPGRYLVGLARAFLAAGGTLTEGVRATGVTRDGTVCHVRTTAGTLSAGHVVVATHFPMLNRGGHFAWLKPRRSYGIAGILPDGVTAGMTINAGSPTHSTRTVRLDDNELLIVVGEGHPVGHVSDTDERWRRLQNWAQERFGVTEVRYHWSAQEMSSLDHTPFVGFVAPGSKRILTATGYDGWGMTNGTAAAMIMSDLVLGRDNPWAGAFDARRAEATLPGKEFAAHNVHVAKQWLQDRVGRSAEITPDDLQPGEAVVGTLDGEETAVYRGEDGELHAVSAICTHMKCNVQWNAGETSWDCPCHGSRFGPDGDVLHGPARTPLKRRTLGPSQPG